MSGRDTTFEPVGDAALRVLARIPRRSPAPVITDDVTVAHTAPGSAESGRVRLNPLAKAPVVHTDVLTSNPDSNGAA